jgi:ribonuclease HI
MIVKIHTDGGSLNNPGRAAIGYLIYKDNKLYHDYSDAIGVATNNIAEYTALVEALKKVNYFIKNGDLQNVEKINCFADSELMVKQLNGLYKIKNAEIKEKFMAIKILEGDITVPIFYFHVLRGKNKEADALVKKALGR